MGIEAEDPQLNLFTCTDCVKENKSYWIMEVYKYNSHILPGHCQGVCIILLIL